MKTSTATFFILLASFAFFFTSCDELTVTEKATEAADEFCDCIEKGKKESFCQEQLFDNYGSYPTDEFMEAFNDRALSECGYKLIRITNTYQIVIE